MEGLQTILHTEDYYMQSSKGRSLVRRWPRCLEPWLHWPRRGDRGRTQESEAGRGDKMSWLGRERRQREGTRDPSPVFDLVLGVQHEGTAPGGLCAWRCPQDGQVRKKGNGS